MTLGLALLAFLLVAWIGGRLGRRAGWALRRRALRALAPVPTPGQPPAPDEWGEARWTARDLLSER